MDTVLIIPFVQNPLNPLRNKAFKILMEHFTNSPWPIIIAKDDKKPYSKSRILNEAVEENDADIIVFNDADSICKIEQIEEAINLTRKEHGLVFAYTTYVRLNQDGEREPTLFEPWRSHGCVVIQRDDFIKLKGYNESFFSWAPDDMDFNRRAAELWPLRRVPGELLHIWHGERNDNDSPTDSDPIFVSKNLEIFKNNG